MKPRIEHREHSVAFSSRGTMDPVSISDAVLGDRESSTVDSGGGLEGSAVSCRRYHKEETITMDLAGSPPPDVLAPSPQWPFTNYARTPSPDDKSGLTSEFSANSDCLQYNISEDGLLVTGERPTLNTAAVESLEVPETRHAVKNEPKSLPEPVTKKKAPKAHKHQRKGSKLYLMIPSAIALFGIGLLISYVNTAGYLPRSAESTVGPIFYDAAQVVKQGKKKTTISLISSSNVNSPANIQNPDNFMNASLPRNSPVYIGVDGVAQHPPTREERQRPRRKIKIWEGQRMYAQNLAEPKSKEVKHATEPATRWYEDTSVRSQQPLTTTKAPKTDARSTTHITLLDTRASTMKHQPEQRGTTNAIKNKSCETKVCEMEAVYLVNYLSWNRQPCTDFYGFVCNRWERVHPDVGTSTDTLLVRTAEEDIFHALTSEEKAFPKMLKMEQLLNSCLRSRPSEDHRSTLLDFMNSFGLRGWPYSRDTKTLMDVWNSASLLLKELNLATLMSVDVEQDPETDNRYIISLGEPNLLIGQYGTKESALPEWYSAAIAICFKGFTRGKYVDLAQRVRDFSVRLAEISAYRGYGPLTVNWYKVVQLKYHINLKHLLTLVFNNITVIHSKMKILVKSQAYLRSLRSVMHVTRSVDVLNYLGFRALLHVSPLLPHQAQEMTSIQMRQITGISQHTWLPWQRCLRMFERVVPLLYLQVYAASNLQLAHREKIWTLLNEIQATFVLTMNTAPWISLDDRILLRSKLSKIKLEVFHKFWSKAARRYVAPKFPQGIEHRGIIMVYKSLAKQLVEKKLSRMRFPESVQKHHWKGSVFDTEPRFDRESNTVFIPMAMFDPSYMIDNESMLLQIPRIATRVIRSLFEGIHENSHPRSELKWSVDTEMGYRDLRTCLQSHYTTTFDDRIRNGLTADLNFLDSMSLLPAFKLFLRKVNKVSIEDYGLIAGSNITVKQLFFILYAKGFCETTDAEHRKQVMQESVYPVNSLRVNGPLRNFFRFPTFWDCPEESLMNPIHKCTIWTS
ncbi:neprilysin-2-like [Ornithodoros turicata]|uniref:neprilysin-2-like n=1 Tax=Ornithodoros turicata TaxID=34597 RepID=UPI003138D9D3